MKSYLLLAILSIFILAGCSSTKSTADYDDVYYSTRSEKKKIKQETQVANPDYVTQNEDSSTDYYVEDYEAGEYVEYEEEPYYTEDGTYQTPEGTAYVTNNYYDNGYMYDDYYDYSYASRINRFYGPSIGFNYYSPCYTGYYYDPWYYNYWYPSFYFSFGWGWGYPYYSPYGYYGSSYWAGYNQGYWDGYYASNYYYSPTTYYYGHRPSRGSSNGGYYRSNTSGTLPAERNANVSSLERNNPSLNGDATRTTGGDQGGTATRTNTSYNPGQSGPSKVNDNNNRSVPSSNEVIAGGSLVVAEKNRTSQNDVTNQNKSKTTKPRYTYKKPENSQSKTNTRYQPGQSINNNKQSTPTQRFSKPNEYSNQKNVKTSRNNAGNSGQNAKVYTRPKSNYTKSYNKPSKYNTSERTTQPNRSGSSKYSQPSRSNTKTYSTPSRSGNTRSYSPPSRSGNTRSYSAPSRSGGSSKSYSTPSRSGGSSPSRSSGGGSRSSGGRK